MRSPAPGTGCLQFVIMDGATRLSQRKIVSHCGGTGTERPEMPRQGLTIRNRASLLALPAHFKTGILLANVKETGTVYLRRLSRISTT